MAGQRPVRIELEDGQVMAVAVDAPPGGLVSDEDIIAKLGHVAGSVETVSRTMLEAVRRVGPTSASVELSFGLAIEGGQLVALFGKAKGEASITVVLNWGATAR